MRQKLETGALAFVAWVGIGDAFSAEVIAGLGYDGLILDAQHGGVTFGNIGQILQAIDLKAVPAFVRLLSTSQADMMRALDLGAAGVIVPMVSTAAQARIAVEAVRYPPEGSRSFGMVRNYYGVEATSFAPLCFVMIETTEAMANLDAIAAVPGVDGLFVGPVDLALSLGLGAVLELREEVLVCIEQVVAACRRHKKVSGCASIGLPYARALLERGVQFIAQGSDLGFIRRGAAAELAELHAWRDEIETRKST
jgi:4-hydroxy-2-oxoheptanedioate aldolase